ncbi:MAG: ABC transporter ATP-binding protein [Paludibacteraceae bacterium]|nr:ABC transporter ATP-binding protein [Paludibacteraceae bacterium]
MQQSLLNVQNLVIGYRDLSQTRILTQPISCSVFPASLIALLGPNGTGKSTLLRTLSGLHAPISGEIELCGKSLSTLSARRKAELVGVVFPQNMAKPNLTVSEYVMMGFYRTLPWNGILSEEDERRRTELLTQFTLTSLSDRRINELSDGEFQRAELARVMAQSTPLVVMDEPTAHLDYPSRHFIMRMLKDLVTQLGVSIIVSTHEVDMIKDYADLFWTLNKNGCFQSHTSLTPALLNEVYDTQIF